MNLKIFTQCTSRTVHSDEVLSSIQYICSTSQYVCSIQTHESFKQLIDFTQTHENYNQSTAQLIIAHEDLLIQKINSCGECLYLMYELLSKLSNALWTSDAADLLYAVLIKLPLDAVMEPDRKNYFLKEICWEYIQLLCIAAFVCHPDQLFETPFLTVLIEHFSNDLMPGVKWAFQKALECQNDNAVKAILQELIKVNGKLTLRDITFIQDIIYYSVNDDEQNLLIELLCEFIEWYDIEPNIEEVIIFYMNEHVFRCIFEAEMKYRQKSASHQKPFSLSFYNVLEAACRQLDKFFVAKFITDMDLRDFAQIQMNEGKMYQKETQLSEEAIKIAWDQRTQKIEDMCRQHHEAEHAQEEMEEERRYDDEQHEKEIEEEREEEDIVNMNEEYESDEEFTGMDESNESPGEE